MPVTYHFDKTKNALMTFPTGLLTIDEITDYFRRAHEDETVPNGFVEVVHFDGVEDFAIKYNNASIVSAAYRRHMLSKKCRGTIFLAKNPVAFGIARMLDGVFEGLAPLRVVSTEDKLFEELTRLNASQP